MILTLLGRFTDARRDLEKCLAQAAAPPKARAHATLHLARVAARLGEDDMARQLYGQVGSFDGMQNVFNDAERAEIRAGSGAAP